nr:3-(methylthio)propionyl-CoA ligase [uncultured Janthinobacterium sp.]
MGNMMRQPLVISSILQHAARHYGANEIVSRRVEGDIHRYTYRECHARAQQLANALQALGVEAGQRVATLAWNGYRHLELYYAVSGSGRVIHTLNPRLHAEQIAYLLNHADDQYVLFDMTFLPLVEAVAPRCPAVKGYVMLCGRSHMPPSSSLDNLLCYEELLAAQAAQYAWPALDEQAASSLCYTSGTTGHPKGLLYTHRSTVLHAYAAALPDALNMSAREVALPVVPMFHVNAWGMPYAAPLTGAKLVLPGAAMDGASLYALFEQEGVTFAAGVPTVWLGLMNYVTQQQLRFSTFRRTIIGGAACPPALMALMRGAHGIDVVHGWGMTELSPLGTTSTLQGRHLALAPEQQQKLLEKQGHAVFGIDMKIVGADGAELPWDGVARGDLLVRGHWVMQHYYRHGGDGGNEALDDGWFATGDVASIDADGYMQITDRSKDVIKSGGEWIGSIDLENIAMAHPAVALAACIGVHHPKWDERPLLLVVLKPGARLERAQMLAFYDGKIARWWTPDDVLFVDSLPIGATGKILKQALRASYRGYQLPGAA